jgi:hypothetical protein
MIIAYVFAIPYLIIFASKLLGQNELIGGVTYDIFSRVKPLVISKYTKLNHLLIGFDAMFGVLYCIGVISIYSECMELLIMILGNYIHFEGVLYSFCLTSIFVVFFPFVGVIIASTSGLFMSNIILNSSLKCNLKQ